MIQMLKKIYHQLDEWDSKLRRSFGKDIETTSGRFWARVHYHLFDHAFLRVFWTNYAEISPGVFRSNQPTEARFRKYHARGLKSVLNLRGEDAYAHYKYEERICNQLGMDLVNCKLNARNAPKVTDINEVIDVLERLPKPLLFHCKSGADRAGLVSAIYLMEFEGKTVREAQKQLSVRFVHLDFTPTGILDYMLWVFEERCAISSIGFKDWINSEYDQQIMGSCFKLRLPVQKVLDLLAEQDKPKISGDLNKSE
jgi:protein tyrosine/serine phosphatase